MTLLGIDHLVAAYTPELERHVNVTQHAPSAEYVHGVTTLDRVDDGRRVGRLWSEDGLTYNVVMRRYVGTAEIGTRSYYTLPDYRTAVMVLLSRAHVEEKL